MTPTEASSLSDIQLWSRIESLLGKKALLYSRDGVFKALEEPIEDSWDGWDSYCSALGDVVGCNGLRHGNAKAMICATARQRCEAWLLWRTNRADI